MPETSQKFFLTSRGARGASKRGGHKGDSFCKIYILGIFGDISSNLSLDRCQKHPKIFLTSRGARGASKQGATRGTVFIKSTFSFFKLELR